MAALAQIAVGLAPALSDSLTVIRGQTGVLLDGPGLPLATQQSLLQIHNAAERASSVIRQLLIVSQQLTAQPLALSLNALIAETDGVLRRLLGPAVTLECDLAADLPPILADPGLLEETLIALALNARDAMPHGGRLRLKTEAREIATESAPSPPPARTGRFVVLECSDTGHGIGAADLPRIFEPFFTTHTGGKHPGLGLAAVFGIVRQHHGWLTVDSAVGAGSSFRISLPALPPGPAEPASPARDRGNLRRHETILFVEDDAAVRDFTYELLQEQGYRVLQATSVAEALEAWQWHSGRIKLLLTDLVLDDSGSGLDLATRLRAENPNLKVICTSGHQRADLKRFPGLAQGYAFLAKPCRPQTLLATIQRLLEPPPADQSPP